MNNPLDIFRYVKNPQAFIQNMMSNNQIMQNPMAKNAVEMFQNGDTAGVKQMAENLCKEKGVSLDEVKNSIMSRLGM